MSFQCCLRSRTGCLGVTALLAMASLVGCAVNDGGYEPLVMAHGRPMPDGPGQGYVYVDNSGTQDTSGGSAGGQSEAVGSDAGGGSGDLAKASQNPVGDLITFPIESIANFNAGAENDELWTITAKPVWPINISEDWNVITRTFLPFIIPADAGPGIDDHTGLGDIQTSWFLSPAKPGKIIWGIGPILSFPSATQDNLGSEKWSAGPTGVILSMKGPWVYGALLSQLWSYAGPDSREDVSLTTFNPFVNYNLKDGWFLTSSPVITANWKANGGDTYTFPVGGGFGKVFKWGKQPMKWKLQGFRNAAHPDNVGNWNVGFELTWLFPKTKPNPTGETTTSLLKDLPRS